jgi:hypothetical protein
MFETVQRYCVDAQVGEGLSVHVLEDVERGVQKHGFTDVYKHYYSTGDHPDRDEYTKEWIMKVFRTMVPVALVRLGKCVTEEEGKEESARILPQVEKLYEEGLVPKGWIGLVAARKPL